MTQRLSESLPRIVSTWAAMQLGMCLWKLILTSDCSQCYFPPSTLAPLCSWRHCFSDQHYFASLLSLKGFEPETACNATLTNIYSLDGHHVHSFSVAELSYDRCALPWGTFQSLSLLAEPPALLFPACRRFQLLRTPEACNPAQALRWAAAFCAAWPVTSAGSIPTANPWE